MKRREKKRERKKEMDEINSIIIKIIIINNQTRKKVSLFLFYFDYVLLCLCENQPTIYNKVNNNSTAIIYFI